jgi:Spy/CpxP family protein refolding chaperone
MLRRLGLAIRKPEAKKGAKGAQGAKAGGKEGERLSKGEAAMMIDTLMKRPATPEQRAELQVGGGEGARGACPWQREAANVSHLGTLDSPALLGRSW